MYKFLIVPKGFYLSFEHQNKYYIIFRETGEIGDSVFFVKTLAEPDKYTLISVRLWNFKDCGSFFKIPQPN